MANAPSTAVPLTAPTPLVLELLAWLAVCPRTYHDTLDAWRTSCPRMPVWEDAVANGFVAVFRRGVSGELAVDLTAEGRAFLEYWSSGARR